MLGGTTETLRLPHPDPSPLTLTPAAQKGLTADVSKLSWPLTGKLSLDFKTVRCRVWSFLNF